jgi:hypothetical protein
VNARYIYAVLTTASPIQRQRRAQVCKERSHHHSLEHRSQHRINRAVIVRCTKATEASEGRSYPSLIVLAHRVDAFTASAFGCVPQTAGVDQCYALVRVYR